MVAWFGSARPLGAGSLRLRATAALLGSAMLLTACAAPGSGGYDPSLSPAQNQLRAANAHFSTTVGEGAAAGALLGGVAGLAFGGRNRAGAALIGAAAGGLLGGGAGYMVARNNLNRASTEAEFTDAITKASADADAYRSSADAAGQVADQAYAEARSLRLQVAQRQITQAQYRAALAKYQGDATLMNQQATLARNEATQLRQNSQVARGGDRNRLLALASDVDLSSRKQEATAARLSRLLAGYDR